MPKNNFNCIEYLNFNKMIEPIGNMPFSKLYQTPAIKYHIVYEKV